VNMEYIMEKLLAGPVWEAVHDKCEDTPEQLGQ
jgi:hypothetical protein